MKNLKMKDLMISIHPKRKGEFIYNGHNEEYFENFLKEGSPDDINCTGHTNCTQITNCSNAQSCNPSVCKSGNDELSNIMDLKDLKNMLADMQIKITRRSTKTTVLS
jgi:hypothetical protein